MRRVSGLVWAVAVVASIALGACSGSKGDTGPAGAPGEACTVTEADGVKTITCGDTSVTVTDGAPGQAGGGCTAADKGDGTKTITCEDGTSITVANGAPGQDGAPGQPGDDGQDGAPGQDGQDGAPGQDGQDGESCTSVENADGSLTITCGETVVTLQDGEDGQDGQDGQDGTPGQDGQDGTSCTVADNGDGTKTITCTDGTSVTVTDGQDGVDGQDGQDGVNAAEVFNVRAETVETLTITIDSVTIASPPVIAFTIEDGAGRGAVGLKAGNSGGQLRFGIAKLVPGDAGAPPTWESYLVNASSGFATYERNGQLVDNMDGTYVYTFATDITAGAVPYDATLTHRVAIQISGTVNGNPLPGVQETHDFVPNGDPITVTRDITNTETCNECHGDIRIHGSRTEEEYCVMCHNPASAGNIDMAVMTHSIHALDMRLEQGGEPFAIGDETFDHLTYPQPLNNCRKCHNAPGEADGATAFWRNYPSAAACGSCHASLIEVGHPNVNCADCHAFPGEAPPPGLHTCATCHTSDAIELSHRGEDATLENPNPPDGAYVIEYELVDATVNEANEVVITFRILVDGAPLDVVTLPADLTGGPSFLLAYALPQDGVEMPADWNNLGRAAAQPATVSLANLRSGSAGTLAADPDMAGYYVATITQASSLFPAGATMRAVALQGYFSQTGVPGVEGSLARHAISVLVPVTGDAERRQIVDSAKCAQCHDWFLAHGGNRVYTVEVCLTCHNPNLSSSGRGRALNGAANEAGALASLDAAGFDPADPLTWPERTQNLKDMLHATHAAAVRTEPFEFVRDRGGSGLYYYDFSHITYPGVLNACETCHLPDTYGIELVDGVLPTTGITQPESATTPADITAARAAMPNDSDIVSTPGAAACVACHDSALAVAHFEQNGAAIDWRRDAIDGRVESCVLCHGEGKAFDVYMVHGQ